MIDQITFKQIPTMPCPHSLAAWFLKLHSKSKAIAAASEMVADGEIEYPSALFLVKVLNKYFNGKMSERAAKVKVLAVFTKATEKKRPVFSAYSH